MRIGFVNIYSWRPHAHQLIYLAGLAEQLGHQTAFLTCDSSVSHCYIRLLRGGSRIRECGVCIVGGVRSFPVSNVTSIARYPSTLDSSALDRLALSSSCTLTRTEADAEWSDPPVVAVRRQLHDAVGAAYESARHWIEKEALEAVVCFNGRIDMTAAVTLACEHSGIPYLTHERTWFGDGIACNVNGNCLSLRAVGAISREYRDKPLTGPQAALAGKLLAERFLQRNVLEWRIYNKDAIAASWPLAGDAPRVLVLPSSRNEYAGMKEWQTGWKDNTQALDEFMAAFGIGREQVVVRFHPNWAEKIGSVDGSRPLRRYEEWCATRGIHRIAADDKRSTYDLIEQADIVVVNGSSAAVEAGVRGKQVYCLAPASYQEAGFAHMLTSREEFHDAGRRMPIDPVEMVRKAMRFIYVNARRLPQFVDYVRAIDTTRYAFFDGADPGRLTAMLRSGKVEAEDASFAEDEKAETPVVEALLAGDWSSLAAFDEPRRNLPPLNIGRRPGLGWVDWTRGTMARGDIA